MMHGPTNIKSETINYQYKILHSHTTTQCYAFLMFYAYFNIIVSIMESHAT